MLRSQSPKVVTFGALNSRVVYKHTHTQTHALRFDKIKSTVYAVSGSASPRWLCVCAFHRVTAGPPDSLWHVYVFWSKPSFLLPAICAVCLLWSQSHNSIEWHGCRRERPGHSLIPLGPISSQSRRSLPDWLLWLMPNARRCSPEATERSPDCVFASGESLRSHR